MLVCITVQRTHTHIYTPVRATHTHTSTHISIRAHLHDLVRVSLVVLLQALKPQVHIPDHLQWRLIAGWDSIHRRIGYGVCEHGLGTGIRVIVDWNVARFYFEAAIFRQLELLVVMGVGSSGEWRVWGGGGGEGWDGVGRGIV